MYFKKEMEPFIQGIHQVLSVSEVRQWAREICFVQRQNKLKPEDFLSICAFMQQTVGSERLSKLCATITRLSGADISKQALHQRFNEKSVAFLKGIFFQLAQQQDLFMSPLHIDRLFSRIRILDATSFGVPKNNPDHPDGAKIQLEYELFEGKFLHTFLYDQTKSDQHAARELEDTIEPGDLILRDLGYFSGEHLKKIDRAGGFYISRVPANMTFWTWDEKGKMMQIKPEALYHSDSFITLIKNIYQNVYRHGRKDHRYQHKSPFDILYLTYEQTFQAV
ncbi:IS4 family transposase [Paraliobacillus sp. X-1268]|uniref:IS4 family transposase n=1 Tax=Paraliobacillus sp. X-1268 TaxID=2213193 RepID=UPI000E3D6E3C|nr:IS4 family transposase [Paraliobacillus sp. X-1268]